MVIIFEKVTIVSLVLAFAAGSSLLQSDVLFVVLSQPDEYHARKAQEFEEALKEQVDTNLKLPIVQFSHRDHDVLGAWTVFPILSRMKNMEFKWIFICEEVTRVHLKNLLVVLGHYSHNKDWFLGHALTDEEPTIIHHFAFHENPSSFRYPSFAAGFALSNHLVQRIIPQFPLRGSIIQFSIDPKHEFAKFLLDKLSVRLENVEQFCLFPSKSLECVASIVESFPKCRENVTSDDFYVAVKTYSQFYKPRVQSVVLKTWAPFVKRVQFFGDVEDSSIPVVDLGIPNTKAGHCAKTLAIMKYVVKHFPFVKWLIIADDDTILGVSKLKQLLSCYNADAEIALGERYGFETVSGHGYDYITGGGGMVFGMNVVKKLVKDGHCKCPDIDSPDDMILGMCLQHLRVPVTHSASFHQARPSDYSPEYLRTRKPVSFHKHWMLDPLAVYDHWFREEDEKLSQRDKSYRTEL